MFDNIMVYLGRLYPEIWAALINVVGLVVVGLIVNKQIVKLTARYNEILARQSPTFELRIQETREFIKLHFNYVHNYLNTFYYHPFDYIPLVGFGFLETKEGLESEKEIIAKELQQNESADSYKMFKRNFSNTNRLIYSFYISIVPERLTFYFTQRMVYFLEFNKGTPFIDKEIKEISQEIDDYINSMLNSSEFSGILEDLNNPKISEHEGFIELQSFWVSQQIALNGLLEKMQNKFDDLWNKPLDDLSKKK